MIAYSLRTVTPSDHSFIFNSFTKSVADSTNTPTQQSIQLIDAALANPKAFIALAVDPDDPNLIFGWIVAQPTPQGPELLWVYVKSVYRHQGIARKLLSAALEATSQLSGTSQVFAKVIPKRWEKLAKDEGISETQTVEVFKRRR